MHALRHSTRCQQRGRCREGLFSRPSQTDQAQISIEMGQPFDLDSEVEGLTGQVSKLKTASVSLLPYFASRPQLPDLRG